MKSGVILEIKETEGNVSFEISEPSWKDPAGWGIVLADVIRGLGEAYGNKDLSARVFAGLRAEFESETDR